MEQDSYTQESTLHCFTTMCRTATSSSLSKMSQLLWYEQNAFTNIFLKTLLNMRKLHKENLLHRGSEKKKKLSDQLSPERTAL